MASSITDLPVTDLDAAVQRTVSQAVGPTATALSGVFVVFFVFNLLDLPPHARGPVMVSDTLLVLTFAAVRFLARREWIPGAWAHGVLVGMGGLVISNIMLTFALLREPAYTTYVLIIVIGGGFLLLSTRWLVVAMVGYFLAWAVVAWIFSTPRQFMNYGFTMFAATVMAGLVHAVRIRTFRRLEALRLTNELRKAELEGALASVEHELAERRHAEARYRQLVDGIEAIVWEAEISETGWRFTFVSDYAQAMLGFPGSAWLDNPNFWLTRVHPDDQQRTRAFWERLQRGAPADASQIECRVHAEDGREVWISMVVNVGPEERSPRQLRGLIFDVTDQKRKEQDREQLQQQLQQAQKMEAIGTLAGGVAHDINNILGAIMGLASLLRDGCKGTERQRDVQDILEACRRGHDLTRNLLGFARRGQYRKVRLSVNKAVREVAELLGRTIERRITVVTDLAQEIVPIEADPAQLNHALINVALNGVDAMERKGTLRLRTRNIELTEPDVLGAPDLRPGRYVSVEISDTGCGMDQETLDHAFEPFFTTKGLGKGTGLGLSMVYGMTQNHGGRVLLESAPGQGTTVTLQFPAVQVQQQQASAERAVEQEPAPRAAASTVLLVDDEALIRAAAGRLLRRLGHQVILARDGKEAVSIFEERHRVIDLVILDMVMPEMDGQECFEELRRRDPEVKVIFTSGHNQRGRGGADGKGYGFLQKPYDLDQLSLELARQLPLPPGQEASSSSGKNA